MNNVLLAYNGNFQAKKKTLLCQWCTCESLSLMCYGQMVDKDFHETRIVVSFDLTLQICDYICVCATFQSSSQCIACVHIFGLLTYRLANKVSQLPYIYLCNYVNLSNTSGVECGNMWGFLTPLDLKTRGALLLLSTVYPSITIS